MTHDHRQNLRTNLVDQFKKHGRTIVSQNRSAQQSIADMNMTNHA